MLLRSLVVVLLMAVGIQFASADMQSDRRAFIHKLIARGAFQKVEIPGRYPHVWVTPLFYELDFELKQKFISVVYAYYKGQNPQSDIVVLFDGRSGKEIGKFAEVYGGLKMY